MESSYQQDDSRNSTIIVLGRLRDGTLVLIWLQYMVGYLVWSAYSLAEGLGPLPALDASYVVAGFVPTIFICFLFIFTRSLLRAPAFLDSWLDPQVRWKRAIRQAIPLLWIAASVLGLLIEPTSPLAGHPITPLLLLLIIYVSLYLAHRLGRPLGEPEALPNLQTSPAEHFSSAYRGLFPRDINTATHWTVRTLRSLAAILLFPYLILYAGLAFALQAFPARIYSTLGSRSGKYLSALSGLFIWAIAAMTVLLATQYFVLWIYPRIPQELGGLQPKCAQLDLAPEELSTGTYVALIQDYSDQLKGTALRTDSVAVLYFGKSFMAVRPARREGQTTRAIHMIGSDAVTAIIWCDQ